MRTLFNKAMLSALALLALAGMAACAQALDRSDVANYAVIHRDGHVTDFIMFASLEGGQWNIEHLLPDGSWDKVTCEGDCKLRESKAADIRRFFQPEDLRQIKPSCVHNSAFAFCSYTMASHPGRTGYLLIGLEEAGPSMVQLKRLEPAWRDAQGRMAPDTEARKSDKGFGAWLIATDDADWKEKWSTSPETVPSFHGASNVTYGEHLTLLTLYANPQTDVNGAIKLLCDIRLTRPDGTHPVDTKGVSCGTGKLQGNPHNTRLTEAVIEFVGDPGDPLGVWRAEVSLTDKNRNVTLPLKVEFTLAQKTAKKAK